VTALVVGLTIGIFAAFFLLAHAAYRDAALQRAVCVACNPTLVHARIRVALDTERFTVTLQRTAAALAALGQAARGADQRLRPLVDLPPTHTPTRSAAVFLTAAERWETWRHRNGSEKYVPKHRAGGPR
jgi:hypothetical protein